MTARYDVLIVGIGPAGSAAATVLAQRGFSVLALEKKRFPRPKLCGGLLTWKSMQTLARVFGLDAAAAQAGGLIEYVSTGYEIIHRDRRLVQGGYEYPFHFVERAAFDQALRDRALAAGARVIENAEVATCDPASGSVTLADGRRFEAAYCVGADGAHSRVRSQCGFDVRAWRLNLAMGVEIAVPRSQLDAAWDRATLYAGFVRAGYCWAFPNKDRVLFGACDLLRTKANLATQFRAFLAHIGVRSPAAFTGHPLPYGNYLEHPAAGRALLVGDAAGLVEPLFGEGIYYALRSGELAAEAIAAALTARGRGLFSQDGAGAAYVAAVQREFLPELAAAKRLRSVLYLLERALKHAPLSLFLLGGGARLVETVHGLRSFRWFRKRA